MSETVINNSDDQIPTAPEAQSVQPPLPPDFVFPPGLLHLWDERVMGNYKYLFRGYEDEGRLKENVETVRWNTCVTYDGLVSLGNLMGYFEERAVEGAYVETGCWMGGSAGMAALINLQKGVKRRTMHLFDSFQGLPEPSEKDHSESFENCFHIKKEECTGKMRPINVCVAKQSDVEDCLYNKAGYPREFVNIHVGWFQDTIPNVAKDIGPIAVLRMDGDFYESTKIALDLLYPSVIPGGLVIIDDWCLSGCKRAVQDYFREHDINPYIHFVDGCVRYFFKS